MQKLVDRQTDENVRRERARKAVALAMRSRWQEAALTNRAILRDFPDDMEAQNRLGKALSELGHVREAKQAFQRALEIEPHNGIARKNLDRLMSLSDHDAPRPVGAVKAAARVFIEDSGKSTTTSLINLAVPQTLLKLAPGHVVSLAMENGRVKVVDPEGNYIGRVEPKLAARLARLMRGGNRYEATVTGSGFQELTIIIRETFKHPSQAGAMSFPSRGASDYRAYMPMGTLDYDEDEPRAVALPGNIFKDWSDDDTEPGDDGAFAPVIHRIISATGEDMTANDF